MGGVVAVEGSAAFFGPLTGLRNAFLALAGVTLALLALVAVSFAATFCCASGASKSRWKK